MMSCRNRWGFTRVVAYGMPVLSVACSGTPRNEELTGTGLVTGSSPTSGDDGAVTTSAEGSSSPSGSGNVDTGAPPDDGDATGEDIKYDVGSVADLAMPEPTTGCEKIDFLFVVDNSGSMGEEQASLTNSFPGFIDEIQNTVMAQDYHIMVIDTDASAGGGCFSSTCCMADCTTWCPMCQANGCDCQCNGAACPSPTADDCDATLGGGKVRDPGGNDCGVQGSDRFMVDGQANLSTTFSCLATVGTGGDGNERPMQAMLESVTILDQAGACNEGFVRDDAILVVTFITDEEDVNKSLGNPTTWHDDLVAVKNGNEDAVVVLGLLGDPAGVACDAEPSPNLSTFATSFTYGSWGSICSANYTPFFHDAVAVIDNACDVFRPEG